MEARICPACGADGVQGRCDACGAPVVDDGRETAASGPPRGDSRWALPTVVAVVIAAVAIGAIGTVGAGIVVRGDAAPAPVAATTTSEAMPTEPPPKAVEVVDIPVTGPVLVRAPRIGPTARYHRDGVVVVVGISVDRCERRDGRLEASGSIRNGSTLGQAFDYVLRVDLRRSAAGPPLAELETTVEGVEPGRSAEWSVSAASTRIAALRCDVVSVTADPVGTR